MKAFAIKQIMLFAVLVPLSMAACATSSIDEILIHRDARDVEKHSFPESKARQISYSMNLKYPATALTDTHFTKLKTLGWTKCTGTGYREGWDSFVDASKGEGRERSVYQNVSHWSKGNTLLIIIMAYDADITKDKTCLDAPYNTRQNVTLIENSNPGTKESLKITCPK
jgi:hypothetical protein